MSDGLLDTGFITKLLGQGGSKKRKPPTKAELELQEALRREQEMLDGAASNLGNAYGASANKAANMDPKELNGFMQEVMQSGLLGGPSLMDRGMERGREMGTSGQTAEIVEKAIQNFAAMNPDPEAIEQFRKMMVQGIAEGNTLLHPNVAAPQEAGR